MTMLRQLHLTVLFFTPYIEASEAEVQEFGAKACDNSAATCLSDHNDDFSQNVNLLQHALVISPNMSTKVHIALDDRTRLDSLEGGYVQVDSGRNQEPHAPELENPCERFASWMVLGAVGFQMAIFYMVNFPDEDIRRYSYEIIGTSLDIFIGVLTFDAVNSYLKSCVSEEQLLMLSIVQMIVWVVLLQLVLLLLSGAADSTSPAPCEAILAQKANRKASHLARQAIMKMRGQTTEDALSPRDLFKTSSDDMTMNQIELDAKCFGGILAHIAGFAAMEVCVHLQSSEWFRTSPAHSLVVAPIVLATIALIFTITGYCRAFFIHNDGVVTHGEELWDEVTQEAENDMICLAISFALVNSLQFWILGELPHEKELMVSYASKGTLLEDLVVLSGASMLVVISIVVLYWMSLHTTHRRPLLVSVEMIAMCFAFMLLGAGKAAGHFAYGDAVLDEQRLDVKIIFALVLTVGSFVLIFTLDKIADRMSRGANMHQAVVKVILSQGLVVGLSWEQCFYDAILHVTTEPLSRMACSILLCAIVVPAYWWYVQPMIIFHRQVKGH
eukprot:TRINITY_DN8403_c0_g1_i1.p1 TRINITY_DN8403_c0_g1~~TRINITY_DN8403_c0_g1_i1.p1  ORF type:complete len:568 (+),score=71.01 TRINITY_DN8403_c0_g1_i1:35-1705(+)